MTDLEQNLLTALDELENSVKSRPAGAPVPNLRPLFSRIDELTARLPKNSDPQLLHFLHKKSYEKARLLLEGQTGSIERGKCSP